jgi:hypothetical protein
MFTRSFNTRRATAAVLACGTALSLVAVDGVALAKTTKSARKTVTLVQGQTKTINLGYPQALKHKGAKYSCTATVSGPARKKVKILSRGPALGGTVCRVKAKNTSTISGLDGTAKVTVTATTTF